jgi:uncharacterized membrane protein
MVCRLILHCTLVCTKLLPKTIARKEILQAQYKIMTYRLWYIITWPAILASIFAYWMLFFTDLGKAFTNALDACKTWLCICIVFIPRKMPTNFQSIAKRPN